MKLTATVLGLMLGSMLVASPAIAQYNNPPPASNPEPPAGPAETKSSVKQPKVSKEASKALQELQTAVNAKDTANIPAKVAAAQAKVKTKDDKYLLAQFQVKAAVDASDKAAIIAALQATVDSGFLSPAEAAPQYMNIARLNLEAKSYDAAAAAFERVLQSDPNNLDATVLLAESRKGQGRTAEAVALIDKAIAAKAAAGQKADESWYRRTVVLAYEAKLPNLVDLSRRWVAAYPSKKSWQQTIRYFQAGQIDDNAMLDTMRLALVTDALTGEQDYFRFTNTLVNKGYAGEAKLILEHAFAAKALDRNRATFSQLYGVATTKAQGDQASLDAGAKSALAATTARQAMVIAEAYYGYGEYQKAADMFRAALGKQDVDKDLANLRLGMSLARAGDKAGAEAALKAAGGSRAEIAKLWLTYLATKA
jgi:tetratricopeptide (TPR) repeat protein